MIDLQHTADFSIQTRLSELRRAGFVWSTEATGGQRKHWNLVSDATLPGLGTYIEYINVK